jgi:hypothetical protein
MQVTQICLKMSKMLSFQKEGIMFCQHYNFSIMFCPQQDYHLSASKYMHMHTLPHTVNFHCIITSTLTVSPNTSLVTANLLKATAHFIYTKMNKQTTKY